MNTKQKKDLKKDLTLEDRKLMKQIEIKLGIIDTLEDIEKDAFNKEKEAYKKNGVEKENPRLLALWSEIENQKQSLKYVYLRLMKDNISKKAYKDISDKNYITICKSIRKIFDR